MSSQEPVKPEIFAVTSVRLPKDIHARFGEIAKSEHRTFSHQMRLVIEEYVAERDALKDAA